MTTILIASVGGQGGLTLSRIIARAALKSGCNVVVGETLGMSQRGGSVHVYIRYGSEVYSPLLLPGEADYLLALEPLEALRALKYIGNNTLIYINSMRIHTVSTLLQLEQYPKLEEVIGKLKLKNPRNVYIVNAYEECLKEGFTKGVNTYMLGFALGIEEFLPLNIVLEEVSRLKFPEKNLKVFRRGLETALKLVKGK
ncbi:MAG TPA: indolepyruvate oxidoreductase subunit beta [Thermoproteales archaeon]|nr:indolepyruvate oxidoreductase subunit beta [Thermoproteales archaeon]